MAEEELKRVYSEAQVLQSYLEELRSRYQIILATISEIETVKSAVTELQKIERGHELLIDLGGGVLARAAISDSSKVLVNVGSGVLMEKTLEEALQVLDLRITGLNKTRETLEDNLRNIEGEIGTKRTRLSELSKSIASQK